MHANPSTLLRCPDCLGALASDAGRLRCAACPRDYTVDDGVPRLVGDKSALNLGEVDTQDYVSDHYEDHRYGLPWSRRYHEHTLDQMRALAAPHGTVLDLGCGNGVFLEHLWRGGARDLTLVGLDVSTGMLRHATRRLRALDDDAALLVQGDACRLPFGDGTFDVVFARGLLHHLPDPHAGMAEIARVLRPGGQVAVLDPNRTVISDLPRRLARKGKHFDDDHKNFAVDELRSIVGRDLTIRDVRFVGYLAYPLLGFPDILDFGRLLPLDSLAPLLMRIDDAISATPGVRRLAWGVMMVADKPA